MAKVMKENNIFKKRSKKLVNIVQQEVIDVDKEIELERSIKRGIANYKSYYYSNNIQRVIISGVVSDFKNPKFEIDCLKPSPFQMKIQVFKDVKKIDKVLSSRKIRQIEQKKIYFLRFIFKNLERNTSLQVKIMKKGGRVNSISRKINISKDNIVEEREISMLRLLPRDEIAIVIDINPNYTTNRYSRNSSISSNSSSDNDTNSNKYSGLTNNGQTCYMNSLLQTLCRIPILVDNIFKFKTQSNKKSLHLALQTLFYSMLKTSEGIAETKNLTDSFGWNAEQVNTQHDVQEFFYVLLDSLEKRISHDNIPNFIEQLMQGTITNYIKCKNIDFVSKREEKFYNLSLSIKDCSNLYESLSNLIAYEFLDGENQYKTDNHGMQDAIKGIEIKELPKILFFHLKRFEFDMQFLENKKVCSKYRFDKSINLEPYLATPQNGQTSGVSEYSYSLLSVLVHEGKEAGKGHYYTFCRPSMKEWYRFNDEKVERVDFEEVEHYSFGGKFSINMVNSKSLCEQLKEVDIDSSAYMLIYVQDRYIKEIMADIQLDKIPKQIIQNYSNIRKFEERKMMAERYVAIRLTSFQVLKRRIGAGLLTYRTSSNDRNLQEFIEDRSNYHQITIERSKNCSDLINYIQKKTKTSSLLFMLYVFNEQKQTIDPYYSRNRLKERFRSILDSSEYNIFVVVPIEEKIKIFKNFKMPIKTDLNDFNSSCDTVSTIDWIKNDNLTPSNAQKEVRSELDNYKRNLNLVKKFTEKGPVIHKVITIDRNMTLKQLYQELGANFEDTLIYQENEINPKIIEKNEENEIKNCFPNKSCIIFCPKKLHQKFQDYYINLQQRIEIKCNFSPEFKDSISIFSSGQKDASFDDGQYVRVDKRLEISKLFEIISDRFFGGKVEPEKLKILVNTQDSTFNIQKNSQEFPSIGSMVEYNPLIYISRSKISSQKLNDYFMFSTGILSLDQEHDHFEDVVIPNQLKIDEITEKYFREKLEKFEKKNQTILDNFNKEQDMNSPLIETE